MCLISKQQTREKISLKPNRRAALVFMRVNRALKPAQRAVPHYSGRQTPHLSQKQRASNQPVLVLQEGKASEWGQADKKIRKAGRRVGRIWSLCAHPALLPGIRASEFIHIGPSIWQDSQNRMACSSSVPEPLGTPLCHHQFLAMLQNIFSLLLHLFLC